MWKLRAYLHQPVANMPAWQFCLRVALIALQFVIAFCLAQKNNPFFYQAF